MQIPFRLAQAGRTSVGLGLILSTGLSTAVFSATPLILPGVIETFDISSSTAGFISAFQLAGFVLTSFLAGRVAKPSKGIFVLALLLLAAANGVSVVVDDFATLLICRFAAGLALGALTWLAWAVVFGDDDRMGSIAVIGPLAGVVVSPVVGILIEVGSFRDVYLALAIIGLVPLVRVPSFADVKARPSARHSGLGAPSAYAVIFGLVLMVLGSSSIFVFGGLIARDDLGISPGVFSVVLALNAAAGIPSASWKKGRPLAGLWLSGCGVSGVIFATSGNAWLGSAAIVFWGFAFWMGVPGAYALLSRVSRYPSERAGDAQAAMAIGRIFGPIFGGTLLALGSQVTLGLVAGSLMVLGGSVVTAVELRNRAPVSTR